MKFKNNKPFIFGLLTKETENTDKFNERCVRPLPEN